MVAQFNDQLKANEIHGIQLHERVEQLQEQLLAIRADLGQLPSYAQLNANLAALPDRFKQDCVDLLQYHVEHDQAPRLRPPIRPRKNEEPVIDKIAFLVHSKELLNHFSCIWDALPQDSFDVLLHGEADLPAGEAFAPWHCQVFHTTDILGKKLKYRYLVSNHPVDTSGELVDQATGPGQRAFHVRCGKIRLEPLQLECPVRRHSLLWPLSRGVFLPAHKGNHRADRVPAAGPLLHVAVGCRRVVILARMRPGQENRRLAAHARRRLVPRPFQRGNRRPDRALQRAGQGASIDARSDPAAIDALSQLPFTRLIVDSTDNLPLYQIADYMLFDYGGPPLAGIYTNKKMILLNIREPSRTR